jgi:GNAT superfamily N-acetyltransferase
MEYRAPDEHLTAADFLSLAEKVWPRDYDVELASEALQRTTNVTAWDGDRLVGCVRILTDGYLFGTIPEIFVDPEYQRQGIGRRLMEHAGDLSPTSLYFGAQPGNEPFFEKLGYDRGMTSFAKRKAQVENR